ncbi:NAD-dependent epimerase/dehydratase family protein, partial [Vibrio anguillarum]
MTILLTGATGFLGMSLMQELQHRKVIVVPLLRSLNPLFPEAKIVTNINSRADFTPALNNIDIIVHCAARVHVMNNSLEVYR